MVCEREEYLLMRERELLKRRGGESAGERGWGERGRDRKKEKEKEKRETYLTPPSNVSDTLLASHVSDTALGCMIIN